MPGGYEVEELLTIYEIAHLFKVDPATIRRYIKAGQLRAFKTTRKTIRITKKDFYAFVKKNPMRDEKQ
jgi:excisionase family DNA binding protein